MAVERIGNLVENASNRLFDQNPEKQAVTNTFILGRGRAENGAVAEDRFTPSAQNRFAHATAQDAGIFQLGQHTRTEFATNPRFDPATENIDHNGDSSQAATTPTANAGPAQAEAAANPGIPVNSQLQVAVIPADIAPNSPAAAQNQQVEIQALNAALPALGLTNAQIQQIDRIASLVHDFNPAAYANLVNQFEALAQQAAQGNAPYATAGTPAPATGGTPQNGSGFQVREIFFHFTAVEGAVNSTATSGGGQVSAANNNQTSAIDLQLDLVQFTLANNTGQAVQVQAPQQNGTAGNSNQQATQNHAASA